MFYIDLRIFGIFPKFGNPDDGYYEKDSIPIKIEFKSSAPKTIHKNFKQPASRSGFKKGNRN